MPNGVPVIGEVVLSPHDKYSENSVDKYDQLLCDSSFYSTVLYPALTDSMLSELGYFTLFDRGEELNLTSGNEQFSYSDDSLIVYFCNSGNDNVYKSTNKGYSWVNLGNKFSSLPTGIACSSDGSIVYGCSVAIPTDYMYKSVDGGASFSTLSTTLENPYRMACSGDGSLVYCSRSVGGGARSLYVSEDGGGTFENKNTLPVSSQYHEIFCDGSGNNLFTYPKSNELYHSTDNGDTWSLIYTAEEDIATANCNVEGDECVVVVKTTPYTYVKISLISGVVFNCEGVTCDDISKTDNPVVRENTDDGINLASLELVIRTPSMTSPDPLTPYRIVADLTEDE